MSHKKNKSIYLNSDQKRKLINFFFNIVLRNLKKKIEHQNFSITKIFKEIPEICKLFLEKYVNKVNKKKKTDN